MALDQVDDNRRLNDPDYYKGFIQRAAKFSLADGETKTLDLKLTSQR